MVAAALAGCSGASELFRNPSESGLFSKPINVFGRPDGSNATDGTTVSLGPSGPVGPGELVGPDGRCAPASAPQAAQPEPAAAAAAPVGDRRVGSMAGDLAGAPMPAAAPQPQPAGLNPAVPPVVGGIALGMTECQAVRRAGLASNVTIGLGDNNQRRVVLTYLGGTWPGIYTFVAGRLKDISRAPAAAKPARATRHKRSRTSAKKR